MIKPYYETPNGKLYNANCSDVLPELEQVDLTVTSPPYDALRNYHGYIFNFEAIAWELRRITKDGGAVVWIVSDATIEGSETGTSFRQALYFMDNGFKLHDTMIYAKEGGFPLNHKRYEQDFEYMFIFVKNKLKRFNPIKIKCSQSGSKICGTKRQQGNDTLSKLHGIGKKVKNYKTKGNIWHYGVGKNKSTLDSIAHKHPAIFPEALAQDHILSWSNEGNTVLDPMSGSGTVPKMCERLNRKWIACEISEEYAELSAKRIEAEASLKLFT